MTTDTLANAATTSTSATDATYDDPMPASARAALAAMRDEDREAYAAYALAHEEIMLVMEAQQIALVDALRSLKDLAALLPT